MKKHAILLKIKVFYYINFLLFFPGTNKKDNANRRRCRQSGSTCPSHYFPGTWTICRKFAQKSQRHYFATWCQNAYPKSFVRFLSLFLFDCKLNLFYSSSAFLFFHNYCALLTICRTFAQKSQRHYFATWCQNAYPKSFVRFLSLFLFDCKLKLFSSSWVFSSFLIIIVYSNYLSKICSKGLATLFYSLVSERLTQVIYKI